MFAIVRTFYFIYSTVQKYAIYNGFFVTIDYFVSNFIFLSHGKNPIQCGDGCISLRADS